MLWFDSADVGQGAIMFGIVQAVADNPLVTNSEAEVINLDINFGNQPATNRR